MNESLLDLRLAVSIGVPSLIAVAGWFLAHWLNARREVDAKRREMRLKGLQAAFIELAMFARRTELTEQQKRGFEQFVAEIQLYGTPKQIDLMIELVKGMIAKKPFVVFDPLLVNLRDTLREELRMEKVAVEIWWYRFNAPAPIAPAAAPSPPVDATN
jgi:hypothetical protein